MTVKATCIIAVLMCENIFNERIYQSLSTAKHYCHYYRSEILWVMSTSVYIPNTDRCFFSFLYIHLYSPIYMVAEKKKKEQQQQQLLSLYLVFKLRQILCVLHYMHVSVDYVACK